MQIFVGAGMGLKNRLEESVELIDPHFARSPEPAVTAPQLSPFPLPSPSDALSQSALPQLEQWLAQLVVGDFHRRWELSKLLQQHPVEVLQPLLDLLPQAAGDEELLWFIARLLGEIDHPDAVDSLAQMLRSASTSEIPANEIPSNEIQSVAVLALANRGAGALPALVELLALAETRYLAVQVLAQIDAAEAVELLMDLVQDDSAEIRAVALEALSGFSDSRIAPLLLAALKDVDHLVRQRAVRGLAGRAGHLPGVSLDGAIAPLLQDFHGPVVEQAIAALGRLDSALGRQSLAQLLDQAAWPLPLQLKAVQALGWSQAPEAVALLLEALERNLAIAATATVTALPLAREIIVVLGRLRPPQDCAQAAQALEQLLPQLFDQRDADLKRSVALALGQLGRPSSFEALCHHLDDPSPGLVFHVVAALRRLDATGGLERLQNLHQAASTETTAMGLAQAIAEWS